MTFPNPFLTSEDDGNWQDVSGSTDYWNEVRKGLGETETGSIEFDPSNHADWKHEDEVNYDLGTCEGCGSYGKAGDTCIRKIDGEMQECGEFI